MTTNHAFQPAMHDDDLARFRYSGARPWPVWSEDPTPAPDHAVDTVPGPAGLAFTWRLVSPVNESFELWAGRRRLARLTIGGQFPAAVVDTNERRLLLTAEAVGDRRVAIRDADTRKVVGDFEWRRRPRRGSLQLIQGGHLEWRRTSRWRPTFTFTDRFGNRLLHLHPSGVAFGCGLGAQDGLPNAGHDLVLMLALGWYLMVVNGTAIPATPLALV